jgi:hypothetical protein
MFQVRLGPFCLRRWQRRGQPVAHGPLSVTPVAQFTEVGWRGAGMRLEARLAGPHQLGLRTMAGERRMTIRPLDRRVPALILLTALAPLAAWRLSRPIPSQEGRHG